MIMNMTLKQVVVKMSNNYWILVWEDTQEPLSRDEMYDVMESYNQLLIQQFADGVE